MQTLEDRKKQAQCEIDAAMAKRHRAWQMWQDADEGLVMARMKLADLSDEEEKRSDGKTMAEQGKTIGE